VERRKDEDKDSADIWLAEWEPRPTSPGSIRLIHFGRMLDDKVPLKGKRYSFLASCQLRQAQSHVELIYRAQSVGSRRKLPTLFI
jgi:hypothetical protein